jgi:hypothetical protein
VRDQTGMMRFQLSVNKRWPSRLFNSLEGPAESLFWKLLPT